MADVPTQENKPPKKRTGRFLLKLLLWLAGIAAFLLLIAFITFQIFNTSNGKIVSSGETREYIIHVPDSYDPEQMTPLVISFHGFAEWPALHENITGWSELADKENFIVVYPMGRGFPLRWAASLEDISSGEAREDVAFVTDLISDIQEAYNIHPNKIYASGFSNGGGMAVMLACERSEAIAAIAGVAGSYRYPEEVCQPTRPVPMIAFHGTDDPVVSYTGGPSERFEVDFPEVETWMKDRAADNRCLRTVDLPSTGTVSGVQYTGCRGNADVILYTIEGAGHGWPGGEPLPRWIVGTTSDEISATNVTWAFFGAHAIHR